MKDERYFHNFLLLIILRRIYHRERKDHFVSELNDRDKLDEMTIDNNLRNMKNIVKFNRVEKNT